MDNDEKRGHSVPVSMEEAVAEFIRAREERIATRRARINEKLAIAKNAEAPGTGDTASIPSSLAFLLEESTEESSRNKKKGAQKELELEETKKTRTASQQLDMQIDESRKQLEQMILDGEVLITNVRVAAEFREKARQKKHDEDYKERLDRLKREASECQEMYDELSQNWEMKAEKVLPMELYKQFKAQKDNCDELLGKKDDLITLMRREIEDNEIEYDSSLEKYQKDTMLMGDRIDDLVDDLRSAFVEELTLIEDYTSKNRELILEGFQNEWFDLLKEFEDMERKNLEGLKTDAIAKFGILNDLFTMTKQESRNLRHKMEDDQRILMQEREQIKYACHLNLEKMAYNLHILQCRSKENVELKNMMKRFLLKLHDKFDNRSASLRKKMELGRKQIEKFTKEINRLQEQVDTFSQKTLHMAITDQKKYIDMWEANEEIVREKVSRILASEKFIFETQLGIEFPFPSLETFDDRPKELAQYLKKKNSKQACPGTEKPQDRNTGATSMGQDNESMTHSNASMSDASSIVADDRLGGSHHTKVPVDEPALVCEGNRSLLVIPTPSLEFIPGPEPDPAIQRRLMKSIAKVICNQSGFIVEEELQRIIMPLIKTEKTLVTLDAVFQSLGISSVDEMQALARYMLKYCKTMKGVMSKMNSQESIGMTEMNVSMTNVLGKGVLMDDISDDTEEDSEKLSSKESSLEVKPCMEDPQFYCDCMEKMAIADGSAAKRRRRKTVKAKIPAKDKTDEEEVDETESALVLKCSPVCCSPSESLPMIVEVVEEEVEIVEEEWEGETDIDYKGSFTSQGATVLSWLENEEREILVEKLLEVKAVADEEAEELEAEAAREQEEEDEEEEEDGEEEEGDEEEEEEDEGTEESEGVEENVEKVQQYPEEELEALPKETTPTKPGQAGGSTSSEELQTEIERETISIASLDSSADASDEFLYIDPNDVIVALQNFIEDYNNRQKVILPTTEELIAKKLEKIKYPSENAVVDYWEGAIQILNPKGTTTWKTVQFCFEEYDTLLKERNELVDETERLFVQNYELTHLLQKHLYQARQSNRLMTGSFDPRTLGYC